MVIFLKKSSYLEHSFMIPCSVHIFSHSSTLNFLTSTCRIFSPWCTSLFSWNKIKNQRSKYIFKINLPPQNFWPSYTCFILKFIKHFWHSESCFYLLLARSICLLVYDGSIFILKYFYLWAHHITASVPIFVLSLLRIRLEYLSL